MKLLAFAGVLLMGLVAVVPGAPVNEDGLADFDKLGVTVARSTVETVEIRGTPGEHCSTPLWKECAADGVTTLICSMDHVLEVSKVCPASQCCRSGSHGYVDCYLQCDPNVPPTLDCLTSPAFADRSVPPSLSETESPQQATKTKKCSRGGNSVLSCESGACHTVHQCIWPDICCDSPLDHEVGCFCKVDSVRPPRQQPDKRDGGDTGYIPMPSNLPRHTFECFIDGSGYYLCMSGYCGPFEFCNTKAGEFCVGTNDQDLHCGVPYTGPSKVAVPCPANCRCQCQEKDGAMICPCTDDIGGQVSHRSIDASFDIVPAPATEIEQRRPPLPPNLPPHYWICFIDYSGYYLCMGGFCGGFEWCHGNNMCIPDVDGLNCLPRGTPPYIPPPASADEEFQPIVPPIRILPSDIDAVSYIANSTNGCNDGDRACSANGRLTLLCHGKRWTVERRCQGDGCCLLDDNQQPYCACGEEPLTAIDKGEWAEVPQVQACSDGETHCGFDSLDNLWSSLKCINSTWVVSEACPTGQKCTQIQGQEPLCALVSATPTYLARKDDPEYPIGASFFDRCTPGSYSCGAPKGDYIIVCDESGHWKVSSFCGMYNGVGCCRRGVNHTAFCNCLAPGGPGGPPEVDPPLASAGIVPRQSPTLPSPPSPFCTPGTYMCKAHGKLIMVCKPNGQSWALSADCGQSGCCKTGLGGRTAFCKCDSAESEVVKPRTLTTQTSQAIAVRAEPSRLPGMCHAGSFKCNPEKNQVFVCESRGIEWHLSATCGGNGCCKEGPAARTAFCMC